MTAAKFFSCAAFQFNLSIKLRFICFKMLQLLRTKSPITPTKASPLDRTGDSRSADPYGSLSRLYF
jgi:hypothetical protein